MNNKISSEFQQLYNKHHNKIKLNYSKLQKLFSKLSLIFKQTNSNSLASLKCFRCEKDGQIQIKIKKCFKQYITKVKQDVDDNNIGYIFFFTKWQGKNIIFLLKYSFTVCLLDHSQLYFTKKLFENPKKVSILLIKISRNRQTFICKVIKLV